MKKPDEERRASVSSMLGLDVGLKDLRLDERTLLYSVGTYAANGHEAYFSTGGIPNFDTIEQRDDYEEFLKQQPPGSEITITVKSWSVGRGKVENATDKEASIILSIHYYMDKAIEPVYLQQEQYKDYMCYNGAFDNYEDEHAYGDDEPEDDMEP